MTGTVRSERPLALERTEKVAARLGAACMVLLGNRNRTWVRRRSETVTFEGYEFMRLSTTLDVVVPEPLEDRVRIGTDRMVLPLDVIKKGPLVRFDLTTGKGSASLLQSREVATVTAWMLVLVAIDAEEPPPHGDEFELLIEICDADLAAAESAFATLSQRLASTHPIMLAEAEHYRDNYILLAEMERGEQVLVKYARDEPLRLDWSPGQREATEPTALVVELASIGFGASYHVEAVVPTELRIMEAQLRDERRQPLCEPQRDRDRVSLYPRRVAHGSRARLTLLVRAQRDVLLLPAAVIATLSTAALAAIGALEWIEVIGDSVNGSAAGVAFIAPSLASGLVLQRPAAPIVRLMLGRPRAFLMMVTLTTIAAAASMAFGLRDAELGITWVILAVFTSPFTAILCQAASSSPSDAPGGHGSAA